MHEEIQSNEQANTLTNSRPRLRQHYIYCMNNNKNSFIVNEALLDAVDDGNLALARHLLQDCGANPSYTRGIADDGWTPLALACEASRHGAIIIGSRCGCEHVFGGRFDAPLVCRL